MNRLRWLKTARPLATLTDRRVAEATAESAVDACALELAHRPFDAILLDVPPAATVWTSAGHCASAGCRRRS